MKRTLAALAATTMLAAGLTACGSGDDATSGSGSTSSSAHDDADVTFVQSMIPHHEQAVRMAEMADDAAGSPEVRDLAERIKAAQGPEIETMQGWLEDWGVDEDSHGGMDHGDGMDGDGMGGDGMDDMPGMMSDADLGDLGEADGAAFDRMFLTMMIAHHEGAIEMAETEIADGEDPDVVSLAKDIKAAQTEEIAQMRRLLGS